MEIFFVMYTQFFPYVLCIHTMIASEPWNKHRKTCVLMIVSQQFITFQSFFWIKEPLLRTAKLYWLIDPSDLQSKEEKHHQTRVAGPHVVFWYYQRGFRKLMPTNRVGIHRLWYFHRSFTQTRSFLWQFSAGGGGTGNMSTPSSTQHGFRVVK